MDIRTLLFPGLVVIGAFLAGLSLYAILINVVGFMVRRSGKPLALLFEKKYKAPLLVFFPVLGVLLALQFLDFPEEVRSVSLHTVSILFIVVLAWLLHRTTLVFREYLLSRYVEHLISEEEDIHIRKVRTQVRFVTRFASVIIFTIAVSGILMTFELVRELGTTILASAGIAGIILGFAAQNTLAALFAGLQVAITQPIRMNDIITVQGESGSVEDITLAHVVVRLWDKRRMVFPIKYFIENPFLNLTLVSKELLGTVLLRLDYSVPVEIIRNEFKKILDESKLWDRKTGILQVTELGEKTIELRGLMSAQDSATLWDLKCEVREKLLLFIQQNFPGCLPKFRIEALSEAESKEKTVESSLTGPVSPGR